MSGQYENASGIPTGAFRDAVYDLVAQIPEGRLMTYGDVAVLCGLAHGARLVGGVAHFGPTDLPWQRVVNRFGGLASGWTAGFTDYKLGTEGAPDGRMGHKMVLEAEGVPVSDDYIVTDFAERRWLPKNR
ncbi:MAG: MGMT family protein [Candidatus Nomurabacteria bacterium]|jgi:methylated-DNA-protein-cysteine methyltransferase-like protein|nr:MGMT family protein [Candidatus Nomurabacteria bacterium]